VCFWEDSWITPHPFKTIFLTLYNIVRKKNVSVKSVLSTTPLKVAFRRSLMVVNLQAWHNVVTMVANVLLTNQKDRFVWGCIRTGCFQLILCTKHY
jgi:hypothetical protein